MKTKTYLRYISCVLAVLLCVASIMPIAFADSTNHGNSESLLTGSNYSVSYSMNGKDVVEQLTIRDGGITRITRTVHPNDVMDIVVVGASGESTTSTARSDYSLFYEIYQDQQNYKNGQLAQIPALTGSEVTGSQFKHRFSYDNSYYTHCYHQTVKEYKSNGSLIRSKTDYYQAIGG